MSCSRTTKQGQVGLESSNLPLTTALSTACLVNSEDPDKMLHYVAFHLGLHCLLVKTKLILRERIHFGAGGGNGGF